ncbi:flagellar brake protein [Fundidesulfovibrio soli]|uniref:flagellar brake protein n=1 Tax=Fundidesulfovibrio soli TaxID=2922716 RepID=UPI001FAF392F|nr:flagellar brake protein [Fundidesulfovibrio soli]
MYLDNPEEGERYCGAPTATACSDSFALASLLLEPGHPMTIRCAGSERAERARVLGLKRGEFIVVRPPASSQTIRAARPGAGVDVLLEKEGTVYAFHSEVLSALTHPIPVLFVGYPQDVRSRALRRHVRHKCLLPATAVGAGFTCEGHLSDFSVGGCRIVTSNLPRNGGAALHHGDPLEVRLPVSGLRMETFTGELRSVQQDGDTVALCMSFHEGRSSDLAERFVCELIMVENLRREDSLEAAKNAPPPSSRAHAPLESEALRDATAHVSDGAVVSLTVAQPLELQFTGNHLYDASSVVAVDGAECIIAEMPLTAMGCCPKPGMGLRGRFEKQGSYYGFRTCVLKFVTKPRPLVFFACPKKIEVLKRRLHPRVHCMMPAALEGDMMRVSGYVTDISMGGCRVLANLDGQEGIVNVMSGDTVHLTLPLDGLRVESLKARVKNFTLKENRVSLGLIFQAGKSQLPLLAAFMTRMEAAGV